jgi:hypothetical protein
MTTKPYDETVRNIFQRDMIDVTLAEHFIDLGLDMPREYCVSLGRQNMNFTRPRPAVPMNCSKR